MDLLLLSHGSVHHYKRIKNLAKLVNSIPKRAPGDRTEICQRCFQTCSSLNVLHRHQAICYQREEVQISMPDAENNHCIFRNINARWFVPRVVYFVLEVLILPASGVELDPDKSNQQVRKHQNCGSGLQSLILDNEVTKF